MTLCYCSGDRVFGAEKGNFMCYVIRRTGQGGGYVSKPGSFNSYTRDVKKMRKFSTKEEALLECCVSNEIIVPIEEVMD